MDISIFFSELESLFKKIGLETATLKGEEPQLGDTLRILLPVTEEGNVVLTELLAAPYNEDVILLQIYSTMIAEIGPGYEALKEMLLDWNLSCPVGAFGIYRQGRQFYHKYNYLMPTDQDPDQMAMEIFYVVHLVGEVISPFLSDALRLSETV